MRVAAGIPFVALLTGLALVGCGASDIKHGGTGGGGGTGNGGGGAGGSGMGGGGAGGGGTGGGAGGGGSGGGGTGNCGVQNFMLQKGGTPDLLIIQDRSGSMAMDANGGNTTPSKWTSITQAIEQVVMSVTSVDWGLMMFPSTAGGGLGGSCSAPTMPDVACAANNAMPINNALNGAMPNGGTPTTDTINAAVTYFKGLADSHDHYLLLATDGEPNCAGGFGGGSDAANAEMAVTNAFNAGIKTVVVGIGANTGADQTLTVMAQNGGMPDTTPGAKPYYSVSSTQDLVNVLNKIAGQIVSCSYSLQMAPANPDYVTIQDNNGMTIPRDKTHMNGWDFGPGNMSVNFYGMACDNLQKGVTTSIQAVFGCPPVG